MSIIRQIKKLFVVVSPILILAVLTAIFVWIFYGPPGNSNDVVVFTVPTGQAGFDLATSLKKQDLIKNEQAFSFLKDNFFKDREVKPGGYRLNKNMFAWEVLAKVTDNPDLVWFTSAGCLRKEQISEKLAKVLGWDGTKLAQWNNLYPDTTSAYYEGVYYPDTYLIPTDESPKDVAQRFIANFNEKFVPLSSGFLAKNIKWTTGLKIASLIGRESGGSDMKIISGIIWNRLNTEMPLQIDATMQYTLGKTAGGSWWGTIDLSQKDSDSLYNSYRVKGLPPTPICSPNIAMIEAALAPAKTDCLFYLHDADGQIHCAKTYKEHLANIGKYLD